MHKIMMCLIIFLATTILLPYQTPAHAYRILWSVLHNDPEYFRKVQADPRMLVEVFCESEFNGAQDARIKVVKFTPVQSAGDKAAVPDSGDNPGKIVNFYSDPVIVVDSYKISGLTIDKDRAEAVVIYRRLANSNGIAGRKYMIDKNDHDVVRLSLEFDGTRWWIRDPSLPRVSKWALIEFSERIISSMNDLIKKGTASDGQKKYYLNNRDIVIFLRSL